MEFIGGIMSKIIINSQGPHSPAGSAINTGLPRLHILYVMH